MSYLTHLESLLRDIGYRCLPPVHVEREVLASFHNWMVQVLSPTCSWYGAKLAALEETSMTCATRFYPLGSAELHLVVAKMTAVAIVMDDSLEDDSVYEEIAMFGLRMATGEPQPAGILSLYQEALANLSRFMEDDPVHRGIAVLPWVSFVDSCLLEKRLVTLDPEINASPLDSGFDRLRSQRRDTSPLSESGNADYDVKSSNPNAAKYTPGFPRYLRNKTSIAEAYAALIFKSERGQSIPLTRFIKAMPDLCFYIETVNDLFSFYKEELEGETANLVQLCTETLQEKTGTGPEGRWTADDTIGLLCKDLQTVTSRIDTLLQVDLVEHPEKALHVETTYDAEISQAIARQWYGFRMGYISWHLETRRYKLDFLRPKTFDTAITL